MFTYSIHCHCNRLKTHLLSTITSAYKVSLFHLLMFYLHAIGSTWLIPRFALKQSSTTEIRLPTVSDYRNNFLRSLKQMRRQKFYLIINKRSFNRYWQVRRYPRHVLTLRIILTILSLCLDCFLQSTIM